MKKIFALIGVVCIGLSLTACSSSTTSTTQSTVETKKVDLSTLDGRKAALTDMILEAYAAYEKKDDTAKIAFINKYYDKSFLNNSGRKEVDLFKYWYTEMFDSNKEYKKDYKYRFFDSETSIYAIDNSNPYQIKIIENEGHVVLTPVEKQVDKSTLNLSNTAKIIIIK